MKRAIMMTPFILLVLMLWLFTGSCGITGGADISIEGLTLGQVTMEGKSLSGLPSDKINLVLAVSAQKVLITTNAERTLITLTPSGGTIEIRAKDVSIKGLKPEQIKVEWAATK